VCFTSDIESIIIAVRHIVVTSQLRCSCDRCCLQYAVQLLIFLRQRSLLLLVYFAVGKTGAVLRSDNFAGCKIVVAARSTTRFAETAQLNRLHFQLFVYHAIGSDHHIQILCCWHLFGCRNILQCSHLRSHMWVNVNSSAFAPHFLCFAKRQWPVVYWAQVWVTHGDCDM
jgi:hypothetical protein